MIGAASSDDGLTVSMTLVSVAIAAQFVVSNLAMLERSNMATLGPETTSLEFSILILMFSKTLASVVMSEH